MNWLINILLHRGNDLSTYFLPNAYFFKRSLLESHQIPLWNPIQFTGLPYLADPQNFIFYLPNYLFVFLPVEPAFLAFIFAHLILGAVGTYFLAKKHFKLSKFPALFAAAAFILTPKIFSHLEAGHYTMLIAFSWLPWFIYVAFKFIDQPTSKKSLLLAVMSAILYLNYINVAYFALLFFYSFILFTLITQRPEFKQIKKYLIHNTLYLILFFGLISPNLLAQIKFAPLSTRNLITYQDVAQPIWSLKLFFQNLFFPFFLNHQQLTTERVLFPGLTIWSLAFIGWFSSKNKFKYFFLGWLVFSLLFSLGDRVPFFIFFYKFFPFIKWLRVTTRLWIITNLLLAIFAGIGIQILIRRKLYSIVLISLIVFSIEIALINFKIFSKPIPQDPTPTSFYELINQDTSRLFRVYCTTGCFSLQRLSELGIYSLSGNNPIQLKSFVNSLATAAGYSYQKYIPILPPYEVFAQQPQPKAKLLGELNAKYVASPYPLTDPDFILVRQEAGYFLYTVQ